LAGYAANANAASPQKEYGYRNGQLLITANCPAPAAKLTVSGATASSYWTTGYEPAKAIDGNTTTTTWNAGAFAPAWIQVDLGQSYSLSQVRLLTAQYPDGYTRHEIYGGPSPSSLTLLGTVDGSTTSSQWLQLTTAATNVRYVKVLTTASPSWIAWFEVEVYQATQPGDVEWLVTDQLGTPRMIFDQTGALATTKRHDYLPFGEELSSVVGLRSSSQGYSAAEGVRQKFTSKERDNETGLDYSINRYYSPTQGRFTSPDQLFADQHESDPQSWNLYNYVGNNPINYTDPFGLWKKADCDNGGQCWQAEDGDTWKTFAAATGISKGDLIRFFQGETITSGQVFDVSGAREWNRAQLDEFIGNSGADQRYMFIPGGGGLVDVNKARGGIGLLSRAASAIGRWFGGGAKTAQAVGRTIEIVQQEGNLVEMVGKSAQGEIRVLTEMTKQGDTLVLKGLHMEGAGPGSMGVRELYQFVRQLGREQGVKKVIIEGAERTTGANPRSIPRTVEIKVN
jgi:RHS repeat-associated protein